VETERVETLRRDPLIEKNPIRLGLALVLLLASTGALFAHGDPVEPIPSVSAERGLALAVQDRKPLLVIAIPGEVASEYRLELAEKISESTRKRLAKEFITIEIVLGEKGAWPESEPGGPEEKPTPWPSATARSYLENRLGRLGEAPVIAVLDFAGILLVRFDGEPPSSSRIKKAVRGARSLNHGRKKVFEAAEKVLEQLGLALKRKQYKDACRLLIKVREFDLPLDSKPAIDREEREELLAGAYRQRVKEVEKIESKDQLAQAVAEYEKVLQQFPLPEWQSAIRLRIGVLWRKIYGRNPPVPGGGG
jgi:hypothetical protein